MIIDVHSHNFPDALAVRAIAAMSKVTEGALWPVGDGTLANQLDHLELAGVDKAVMCPIATRPQQDEVILRSALDLLEGRRGERARRRIIPFVSVHPDDPHAAQVLARAAAAGIRGVKFHPYYQGFRLDDPTVWTLFGKIAALGLVVVSHAGADLAYLDRWDVCGPQQIARLLRAVPMLKFVASHLGGSVGYPPHATDVLLECGAYIDTSVLHAVWHGDEQQRLLRSWPTDRILFGTDFPWVHYPEAINWVKSVRAPADWDALFGGNAARLLGL